MAETIYSGTYVRGIVLDNPATQNPATIASTGEILKYITIKLPYSVNWGLLGLSPTTGP